MEPKASSPQRSYKISFDQAVDLIFAFLSEFELYNMATNEAIGGVLHKSSLATTSLETMKKSDIYYGCMSWFCRNTDINNNFPAFFLAFEEGEYDIEKVPNVPKNEKLVYSSHSILYKQNSVSKREVSDFLKNGLSISPDPEKVLDKSDCVRMLSQVALDKSGKPYNKYYCSFFENKGFTSYEFSDLLNDPQTEYIAYLFGYDDSTQFYKDTNRVRVILMGLTANGKPVALQESLNNSSSILQHSWPPPPNS